jgi:hypothetical protein
MMWPRDASCRHPDMVVGANDWNALEGFLRDTWGDPEPVGGAPQGPSHKWHFRVILQNGERVYLNLLWSETAQRSRITARAAAKLG